MFVIETSLEAPLPPQKCVLSRKRKEKRTRRGGSFESQVGRNSIRAYRTSTPVPRSFRRFSSSSVSTRVPFPMGVDPMCPVFTTTSNTRLKPFRRSEAMSLARKSGIVFASHPRSVPSSRRKKGISFRPGSTRIEERTKSDLALVDLSAICFALMQVPQVIRHAKLLRQGAVAPLLALSIDSVACSLVGNALLLRRFRRKGEEAAARVQALGTCFGSILLVQIACAGRLEAWKALLATIYGISTVLLAREGGKISFNAWTTAAWDRASTCVGGACLAYVSSKLLGCNTPIVYVILACVVFVVICVLEWADRASPSPTHPWEAIWDDLSSWSATLLFMLMPVSQVLRSLSQPWTVGGISLFTVLLGWLGNALMLPRAIAIRDGIWVLGAAWGATAFGWGQCLALTLARTNAERGGHAPGIQELLQASKDFPASGGNLMGSHGKEPLIGMDPAGFILLTAAYVIYLFFLLHREIVGSQPGK